VQIFYLRSSILRCIISVSLEKEPAGNCLSSKSVQNLQLFYKLIFIDKLEFSGMKSSMVYYMHVNKSDFILILNAEKKNRMWLSCVFGDDAAE